MKIKNIELICLLLLMIAVSSCEVFDHDRIGAITPDEVWGNPNSTALYVNNFYPLLPAWNRNEAYSEEAGNINIFLNGKMQASNTSDFPGWFDWSSAYTSIRSMNVFFENIDQVPGLSANGRKELKGQVYFFRALQYYQLLRVYGGVPIITDVQDPTNPSGNMVARNTSLECFIFVAKDLDSAIYNLPSQWPDADLGRITKGAAMALKAQVLMLKASPLFCPKQNHPEYWTDAYNQCNATYKELNDNGYGLYTTGGTKAYENMWYDKTGAKLEMVLSVRYAYPQKTNGHQTAQRPLSVSAGDAGGCQPTWEMVQAYPMKNGKNIDDHSSGYDVGYFWVDRDPRFYKTIVFHSAVYGFGEAKQRIQWTYPEVNADGYGIGRSGFYCRKEIDTTLAMGVLSQQAFDWPIIRYAEVLLDLAECANEIGNSALAKECIVKLRQRAGIEDDGSGNYGLATGVGTDYDATLAAVMKERQIELAYEGKRYFDLRRRRMFSVLNSYTTWHAYAPYLADTRGTIADTTGHNLKDIIQITSYFSELIYNPPAGSSATDVRKVITRYAVEPIDRNTDNLIKIPDTYYFYPLSPDWIQKDENLIQNIGWENGTFDPTIP